MSNFSRARAVGANASADVLPFPDGLAVLTGVGSDSPNLLPRPDGATTLNILLDGTTGDELELVSGNYVASDDVDAVLFAVNQLTVTGHAYSTGDGPYQLTTATTLPTGLSLGTDYWVYVVDANTIQLCLSLGDAVKLANMTGAGVPRTETPIVVEFDDAGTGTHTIESGFPAAALVPVLTPSALPLIIVAGVEQRQLVLTAPPQITAQLSATAARAQFWWS